MLKDTLPRMGGRVKRIVTTRPGRLRLAKQAVNETGGAIQTGLDESVGIYDRTIGKLLRR